ncbi:hypothetical protein BMS3Bbin03_02898 [bacterium BMS3Bbin03]|nr:hypothetical protein BMS3Bbin03_02898 [bacterium BMS3Bbin03]
MKCRIQKLEIIYRGKYSVQGRLFLLIMVKHKAANREKILSIK